MKIFSLSEMNYNSSSDMSYIYFFYCSESVIDIHQNMKKDISNYKYKKYFVYINKYNNADRGSYCNLTYTVRPGDTLCYIAWLSGNSCLDLARSNNIQDMHSLKVGQILKVRFHNKNFYSKKLLEFFLNSLKTCNLIAKKIIFLIKKNFLFTQVYKQVISHIEDSCERKTCFNIPNMIFYNKWHWPTYGKVINTFSESEGGNKGIDISGKFGQPILAVSNGKVVYVGNILKGYGNLIIIKHDNDCLSAYAHNNIVLVYEQQRVKVGDKIATMGNSGTDEIKLHFEIQYKGKSVDPLYYLSKHY